MSYDVDYFIKFYSAIPDNFWCVGKFTQVDEATGTIQHCAMGHLNEMGYCTCDMCMKETKRVIPSSEEVRILKTFLEIIKPMKVAIGYGIEAVNDDRAAQYQQETPKARVLAALNDIKNGVYPPVEEKSLGYTYAFDEMAKIAFDMEVAMVEFGKAWKPVNISNYKLPTFQHNDVKWIVMNPPIVDEVLDAPLKVLELA